jgi:hypothetical protein
MKRFLILLLAVSLVLLLIAPVAFARSDRDKPLQASDVELVKKVTLKGPKAPGGKPVKQAATGVLGTECTGTKYAIIIGISDYPGTADDLDYCDDDARDMYNALTSHYGYDDANIHLLIDADATFDAIRSAVADIETKALAGDEVVFFFSGHGARGKANDGDRENIDEAIVVHDGSNLEYIWDGQLKTWFEGFDTSRIILIFDSCLAGGMTDLKADGRVIAMACSENGLSYEGDAWGNGQFTYYFVDEGMLQAEADKYDNMPGVPDVTVEEAFDYAKANCVSQTPTISDSFANDLLP